MATPMTIGGTMMGETMRLTTSVRRRRRPRSTPYAASVPSTVEPSIVTSATSKLSSVACSHGGWLKYERYQRNDHPGGGKARQSPALSGIGTAMDGGRREKK